LSEQSNRTQTWHRKHLPSSEKKVINSSLLPPLLPGGAGAGPGISSEGDPTVDADLSNDCSLEQNLEVDQNAESGDDLSTNEWDG
jgi:hypothetical protein